MTAPPTRRGTRERHPVPPFVERALLDGALMAAYRARPLHQQNDHVGWIARAKLEGTRRKRLAQMLDELRAGDRYMNMAWRPARRPPGRA